MAKQNYTHRIKNGIVHLNYKVKFTEKPWCATTPEEVAKMKKNKQRIADIKNKIEWNTATYAERNILNIYNKKMKKANGSK